MKKYIYKTKFKMLAVPFIAYWDNSYITIKNSMQKLVL